MKNRYGIDRFTLHQLDNYNYLALQQSSGNRGNSNYEQGGQGFREGLNSVLNTGKKIGNKLVDAYTGEIGTNLRNLIPGTHEFSGPAYAGEKHQLLFHQGTRKYDSNQPANKVSTASYSGPQTKLIKRLKNGSKPLTATDESALRHDVDFAIIHAKLSRGEITHKEAVKMVRDADSRMLKNLARIQREKKDTMKNIGPAITGIGGKIVGEETGVLGPASFSGIDTPQSYTDEEIKLLEKTREQMEQKGYGKMKPGDKFKIELLKKQIAERKKRIGGSSKKKSQGGQGVIKDGVWNVLTWIGKKMFNAGYKQHLREQGGKGVRKSTKYSPRGLKKESQAEFFKKLQENYQKGPYAHWFMSEGAKTMSGGRFKKIDNLGKDREKLFEKVVDQIPALTGRRTGVYSKKHMMRLLKALNRKNVNLVQMMDILAKYLIQDSQVKDQFKKNKKLYQEDIEGALAVILNDHLSGREVNQRGGFFGSIFRGASNVFRKILKPVRRIAKTVLPIVTPLLGPKGQVASNIAQQIL